jgi:hypothetical protein
MGNGTIMIIGLGEVGGKALEILARKPGISRIVTADVNEEYGQQKTNNAVFGAQYEGFFPNIDFIKVNLHNSEETAAILKSIEPFIIFNSTSLQSYWVVELLPKEVHKKFQSAGYGPWLPMHLTFCYNLMRAVKEAGMRTYVINGAYPDAVNPVLSKMGLAPIVGIGNIELVVPQLRKVISLKLKVPIRSISIFLVMHHYAEYWVVREGHTGGAPYFLKVLVDGDDVSKKFSGEQLFSDIINYARRPGRPDGHYMVASSAIQKIMSIYNDTQELSHAPGPEGLIGGYPIRLGAQGVEVILPREITKEEAVKINEDSQKMEGIEEIKEDGTVRFTDKSCKIMKELLGYDCKEMKINDCAEKAHELGSLYKRFTKRYIK